MDRNNLTELPYSLRKLKKLQTLQLAQNQLAKLPPFLVKMRTLGLTVQVNTYLRICVDFICMEYYFKFYFPGHVF